MPNLNFDDLIAIAPPPYDGYTHVIVLDASRNGKPYCFPIDAAIDSIELFDIQPKDGKLYLIKPRMPDFRNRIISWRANVT